MIDTLKSSDGEVRIQLIRALGKMGVPAAPAVPIIVALLPNADPALKIQIAESLGEMGTAAKVALAEIEKGLTSNPRPGSHR